MPPRYSYWTIIAGGLPTAFRAADREDLLPTFSQIRHKQPDAQLKWFARGKLWDSPESARRDTEERRRPKPTQDPRRQEVRGRDWRPGGKHRDPRQKYKDAKKEHNARERKRKFERRQRERPAAFAKAPAAKEGRPRGGFKESRPRNPMQRHPRTFQQESFARNQRPGERPAQPQPQPQPQPRPEPPEREPRPREGNEPTPPPRPAEPAIPAPGPPERGRFNKGGRFNKSGFNRSGRFNKDGRSDKKGPPRR
jgi:hypothetical protein